MIKTLIRTLKLKKSFFLICIISFFSFISVNAIAQPSITSITPLTGKPGDTITIVGSNFAGTVALTDVFFGNAKVVTYRSASSTTLRVIVPIGATYAPITVMDKLNKRYGLSRQFFSPVFSKPKGSFTSSDMTVSAKFSTGTNPYNVAVGDIDGDGKQDAAVVNYSNNTVSVLRNTSTVGTISFDTKVDFTTGANPYSVALADIDNDTKLDIIVVNNGANTISVLKNNSTSGTLSFATKVDYSTGASGSGSTGIAVADIDRDGWQDVLVCNGGNNKVSYLQNTSTTTAISFATKVEYTTGTTPRGIAIGDIDGDNKLDIVVTNAAASSISVIRNTMTIAGSLTLATKVDYSVGLDPTSVALGDINADGKLDVIVSNYNATNISTLRNTSVSGTVTLATAVNKSSVSFPETVAITDIDADGKLDIMYANDASSFSVLKNTTTTATSPTYANSVDFTTGSLTKAHAMGDIDGDGKIDAVVITNFNNAIVVVRNNPQYSTNANLSAFVINTTAYTPILSSSISNYTAIVTNATTSVTVKATKAQDSATIQLQLNGGTYTALASGVNSSALPLNLGENVINIKVTAQDGTTVKIYTFTVTRIAAPTITSISPTSGPIGTSVTLTGTFFNSTPTFNAVYFGATKATITAGTKTSLTVTVPTGATYAPITVINLDDDVIGSSSQYFNTTFKPNKGSIDTMDMTASANFGVNTFPGKTVIGDIDGDGKSDAVVIDNSVAKFSVLRNTSTSGTVNFASKIDFTTLSSPRSVTLADINNDGKLDVIVAHFMDSVSIFRNTSTSGNISFAQRVSVLAGLAISVYSKVVVGDIDGDGSQDIILGNVGQYQVNVLRNTSTSATNISFAFFSTFATGNNPVDIAIGDINSDGKADIITANASPANATGTAYYAISILRNTSTIGTISFATKQDFTVDGQPSFVALGDINGDGVNDIVTGNVGTNNVSVLINYSDNTGLFMGTLQNFTTGANSAVVGVADIDGDGKLDIVNTLTGKGLAVLRNISTVNWSNSFAAPVLLAKNINVSNIIAGDIDGDGKVDITGINTTLSDSLFVLRNTPVLSSNNSLLSLSVNVAALNPVFDSLNTNYNINVHNYATSTTVTATKAQDSAKIEMQSNGGGYASFTSGSTSSSLPLNIGANTINIKVTAQNGNVKIYTITITRACLASPSTTNLAICSSQLPYTWNGLTFNAAGTQSTILTTANGCDSSVTLNLSLKANSTSTTTLSACDSLVWNGTTYKTSGLYTYKTVNSVGCDSSARVNLTIKKSTTSWTDVVTCDSTKWNGVWYKKSGFYTVHFTNKAGCDSAASLNLTVNNKPNGTFSSASYGNLCAIDSAIVFFDLLSKNKQYLKIIAPIDTTFEIGTASFGADIKTVPLSGNSFIYLPNSSPNNQACSTTFATGLFSGRVVIIDRGTCTFASKAKAVQDAGAAGIIIVNNVAGASANAMSGTDATITIPVISVSQADGQIIKNWMNANQFTNGYTVTHTPTYLWSNGKTTASIKVTPTQTTTYSVNVSYENGCSQTFSYALLVRRNTTSWTDIITCDSTVWNGVTYKTSGQYVYHTLNTDGCDSAATLNLTITPKANAGVISGNNSFCFIGGSTTLTTTGDAGGSWSSSNSNRVSVTSAGKVTASMGGNYTIYYVVVNSCGRDTARFNIKVNVPSSTTLSVTACGSYTWGGNVYTATGVYTKTGLTNVGGCDSTSSLDLTINPLPVITSVTANPTAICAGNSSVLSVSGNGGLVTSGNATDLWFNTPITFNNSSNVMLPNAVEFTRISITTASTINSLWVELWQNAPSAVLYKMAIYTNDATTNRPSTLIQETNQVNNASGTALVSGRNQMTLNPTLILQPGIYWVAAQWQGGNLPIKQYTGSIITSYYHSRNYSLGFPGSVTSSQLTSEGFVVGIGLRATTMATTTATYSWSPSGTLSSSTGTSVTATPASTRTYTVTAKNGFNCTASSTVTVTVNNATSSTNNLTLCANQTPYLWNGINYNASGTYTKTGLTNSVGCDSTATLNLTVLAPIKTTIHHKICETALPFTTNGLTFNEAGSQIRKLVSSNGCDSVVTHILATIGNGVFDNATVTQPQCDSVFGNINVNHYSVSRKYKGSIDSLDKTQVGLLDITNLQSTACGDPVVVPALVINDSRTRLYESYKLTNTSNQPKCFGFGLTNYNGSHQLRVVAYLDSFVSSNPATNYLASMQRILGSGNQFANVTVPANKDVEFVVSNFSNGASYGDYIFEVSGFEQMEYSVDSGFTWQSSKSFNVPQGKYNIAMRTADTYCTKFYYNNPVLVNAKKLTSSTTNISICDSLIWNGITYKQSGTYTYKTLNAVGCDSTATLNLTIKQSSKSLQSITVCDSLIWNGTTYKQSGTYTFKTNNSVGCDSVATLNLTIKKATTSSTSLSICDSVIWNNTTYKSNGTYTYKTLNAVGCDSVAILNLTIKNATTSSTSLSVCDSVIWNNTTYKQSGTYTYKTLNAVGCDSVATLNLTIKKATTSSTSLSVCDSVIWNNITYKQSGTYTYKTLNAVGCDSVATLNLVVKNSTVSITSLSICPSQLPYSWNGLIFSVAGSQTKTGLQNSLGCDSTATLNLFVKSNTSSTTNLSICPSQLPYSWNGLIFSVAGSQTKTGLQNSAGCDSSATLNLFVKSNTSSTTNLSICPSQLPYSWNGLNFSVAGSQTKTGLQNSAGCDSSATLNLSVKVVTYGTLNKAICSGQNYLGHSTTGTYTDTLMNSVGCDSVRTLHLTVTTSVTPTVSINTISTTVCKWYVVEFNATASNQGTNPIYKWYKNGITVGTNASIYKDSLLNNLDSVWCVLVSSEACVTDNNIKSNTIKMNVSLAITGTIKTAYGSPVSKVVMYRKGTINDMQIVNSAYTYSCIDSGNNVSFRPFKNNDVAKTNGVNSVDVLLVLRHILNTAKLNSAYKLIAADVDGNKTINSVDVLRIKRLILGTDTTFTKTVGTVKTDRLWEFVDSAYQFPDTTNPFSFKDSISLVNLKGSKTNQTFIGVKLGDVNDNWNATMPKGVAVKPVEFIYWSDNSKVPDLFRIPVAVNNFKNIAAMQYTLHFDNTKYEFVSIEGFKSLKGFEYNATQANTTGNIAMLWTDKNAISQTLENGSELFTLILKAKVGSRFINESELLLTSDIASVEAWDNDYKKHNIVLTQRIKERVQNDDIQEIYSISPNPSNGKIRVKLLATENRKMTLILTNVYGKIIYSQVFNAVKGINAYDINLNQNLVIAKGIYLISIKELMGEKTKRLIIE